MSIHIVTVSFMLPPLGLEPPQLIEAWRMLDIPRALVAAGAQVTVLQAGHDNYLHNEGDINIIFVKERGPRLSISGGSFPPLDLMHHIRSSAPDVIHVHGLHYASQILYLSRFAKDIPIVLQDHANKPPTGTLRQRYHSRALACAAAVTFSDIQLAEEFYKQDVLSRETPVYSVWEGSTRFTPGPQELAQTESGINGAPCCLWVGDLNPNKDPLTVIKGIELAVEKLPGLKLWMCFRQAPLLREVESYVSAKPELRERVMLLGGQEHKKLENLYRACDFYVSASHREGGAYSALEALACGAQPIVSDIPVFRAITAQGSQGGLFANGSAEQLAEQLVHWSDKISEKSRNDARKHFEENFSVDVIARSLLDVYQDASQGK